MTRTTTNRFAWVVTGRKVGPLQPFDVDLCDFQSAAVVPTIGSLVPSWLLVVPKYPATCVADMPAEGRADLNVASVKVAAELVPFPGKPYTFEHGSRSTGNLLGCGVDQAHLHLVNLTFDFVEAARAVSTELVWTQVDPADPWQSIAPESDYYLISNFDQALVAYPTTKVSQFFRRAIASKLGVPDQWDYRRYPHERNAQQTIRTLRNVRTSRDASKRVA